MLTCMDRELLDPRVMWVTAVACWTVTLAIVARGRVRRRRAEIQDQHNRRVTLLLDLLEHFRAYLDLRVGKVCRDPNTPHDAVSRAESRADRWKAALVLFVDARLGPVWAERVQATQSKLANGSLQDHLHDAYWRHRQLLDRMIYGVGTGEIPPPKAIRPSGHHYPKTGFARHIPPPRVVAETETEEYLRGKRELED